MKKTTLLALAAAAAVAVPATASAKEITALKVCGASGCASVDKAKLSRLGEEEGPDQPSSVYNPAIGAYYTVSMSFGMNGETLQTHDTYWLADRGLMRGQEQASYDAWWRVPDQQIALLKEAAAAVQPFTPALRRVVVGRKAVADPSSYMRLLGPYPHPRARPGKNARWIRITLRGTNPWVDGVMHMRYQPRSRVLKRDYDLVKLPKSVGHLVVRRVSLAPPATTGGKANAGGAGYTALYAGIGAFGLVAAGLALAVRRRTR